MRVKIQYEDHSSYTGKIIKHTKKQVKWEGYWTSVPAVLLQTDSGGIYLLELQQFNQDVKITYSI